MKIKSYSLIEILLASMIFMIVIFMVVSSFGMIKKSNENTGDLANTTECARQIENITTSVFKSASYHQPRIMPVTFSSGDSSYHFGEELSADTGPVKSVGFAIFEKSSKNRKINVSVIVKRIDENGSSGYYYDTTEMHKINVRSGGTIGLNASADNKFKLQPIHSSECRALSADTTYEGVGDPKEPFEIRLNSVYEGGPSSLLGGSIFSIKLNDVIFSKYSDQTLSDKTASRLYLETINNISAI